MTLPFFVLLGLAHLVRGSSTDSSCPASDGTTRSVWSILGSCALTLLICIWHALHPDVPKLGRKWHKIWLNRIGFVLLSFFVPEVVVGRAGEEWCKAHRQIKEFREKGHEWSMTHGHFARMYGFVYRDKFGSTTTIDSDKLLELCKEGNIADPLVTEKQIKDKSKSDGIGKAIFTLQLFWFGLQVVVRGSQGLAITLVELDTVCMAVLALIYLFFWWDKPLRPDSPHVFCWTPDEKVYSPKELSDAWKAQPSCWDTLFASSSRIPKAPSVADGEKASPDQPDLSKPGRLQVVIEKLDADDVLFTSIFITWLILGALHLVAWDFEFPTEIEKVLWRVASLVLAGSSPGMLLAAVASTIHCIENVMDVVTVSIAISGVVSRALLVGLMLASLRALPCSAHDTVSWTAYIPHL